MFAKTLRLAAFGMITLGFALPARAGWLIDFCTSVVCDAKERNHWPDQYLCQDRQAVAAPFDIMIANGWQRQNTLGDHHFDSSTGLLNEAGRLKVQWILLEAPVMHREIFVHRSLNSQVMAMRMQSVQELAAELAAPGTTPAVMTTDIDPPSARGDWIDASMLKYQKSSPDPRVPKSDNSGQQTQAQ
jgi:hypothetical protein